jgi:hypothetical protein
MVYVLTVYMFILKIQDATMSNAYNVKLNFVINVYQI